VRSDDGLLPADSMSHTDASAVGESGEQTMGESVSLHEEPPRRASIADEFEVFQEPVQLNEFEEKLVTVHVAAQRDGLFRGTDLKKLFDQHGYEFGAMSLYHCSLDDDKVFSVANMMKPGTFEEGNMAAFQTPGITLFMRLPISLDADVAFDFLIREAQELAQELDGQLRDVNRNPLSDQTIQHMREDVQQYLFRTKMDLTADLAN